MIIFSVEIQELLIGQIRNSLRIPAGFIGIGRIRKKNIRYFPFQHIIR